MFHIPERFRVKSGRFASNDTYGNNGHFEIFLPRDLHGRARILKIIASDELGWDHVSVHVEQSGTGKSFTPTWDEMSIVKSMFWDKDDCVIQYHPPQGNYVNTHPNVLHLWRPQGVSIPMPPIAMV